jgi:hypothetical protein
MKHLSSFALAAASKAPHMKPIRRPERSRAAAAARRGKMMAAALSTYQAREPFAVIRITQPVHLNCTCGRVYLMDFSVDSVTGLILSYALRLSAIESLGESGPV